MNVTTETSEYYNTKMANSSDRVFIVTGLCAYCGKKMEAVSHPHRNQIFYHCNCADAQKEHEITLKILELEKQLPKERFRARQEYVVYPVTPGDGK